MKRIHPLAIAVIIAIACVVAINLLAARAQLNGTVTGSARSAFIGSSNAVVSNTVANFIPIDSNGTAQPAATEGDVSGMAPIAGVVRNLTCVLTTAAGVVTVAGGTNYVMALRQNLATTSLTCTIAAAASSCNDTNPVHAVAIAVNDQLDFIATPNGTPTALVVHCSAENDQ